MSVRICVLQPALDSFKGGNHLPLLGALRGSEVTIVTRSASLDANPPTNVKILEIGGPRGPYYYGIADTQFALTLLRKHPADSQLWSQFDVIHLNQTLSPMLLRLRESGTPLLYAVHHPVTADLSVAREESGMLLKLRWNARYRRLVRAQRRICTEAPNILTVSQTVRRRLKDDYGVPADRVQVVHNGVDGNTFRPSDASKTYDVCAVGSYLHPRKGFPYLLETYRTLAKEGNRIADVGRRSADQAAALREISGVSVLGTVPHDELISVLQSSRCLISTSLYEGFGLSLIEALACGIPAFAFDAGAVSEVLSPIDPALIVPLRDTEELARRARNFLAHPQKDAQQKSELYRRRVLELYSIADAARALENLYASLKNPDAEAHLQ